MYLSENFEFKTSIRQQGLISNSVSGYITGRCVVKGNVGEDVCV